jgi:hypothetical protein
MPADGLIYVPLSRATVGLIVAAGVVTDVAPYVRRRGWRGRDAREVWRELRRQGVAVQWVPVSQIGEEVNVDQV